ncbi:HXXEE domain-containing protein [Blastopirellula marina]|uniref:HXXEE domain-containing protein n=1 Tax=Blastopirellula marina TaxID=124 RepID=A0A2S8GJD0_9BACT|nr:HXXEE domain-containing protein [Blastopirellula marina]PQO44431.1 HXXEE domain-containing protein [Blastopirellula marina]
MWNWLVRDWQWPSATLFAAVFLTAFLPLVALSAGLLLTLIYVQLPVYMLHQFEEHRGDRFRLYINRTIGHGKEALTPAATFWINSLGVWLVDLLALYLAWLIHPAAGLATGYLAVVNAVPHIGMAIRNRQYNPGLTTAVTLLLPIGLWCVIAVGSSASWQAHLVGLAVAIGVHVAIVVYVAKRLIRLKDQRATPSIMTPTRG